MSWFILVQAPASPRLVPEIPCSLLTFMHVQLLTLLSLLSLLGPFAAQIFHRAWNPRNGRKIEELLAGMELMQMRIP